MYVWWRSCFEMIDWGHFPPMKAAYDTTSLHGLIKCFTDWRQEIGKSCQREGSSGYEGLSIYYFSYWIFFCIWSIPSPYHMDTCSPQSFARIPSQIHSSATLTTSFPFQSPDHACLHDVRTLAYHMSLFQHMDVLPSFDGDSKETLEYLPGPCRGRCSSRECMSWEDVRGWCDRGKVLLLLHQRANVRLQNDTVRYIANQKQSRTNPGEENLYF